MLASATIALTLFAPVSAALADPADEVAADSSMTVSPAKGTSVGGERVAIAPSQFDREWVHVGRGDYQSFAVTRDGSIYAWGSNRQGRLGIGSGSEHAQTPTRIPTPDGTPLAGKKFTQAEGGLMHGVALDTDGVVYTWGNNSYGQLGNGTHGLESSTISPVAVPTAGTPMAGKTIVKIFTRSYTTLVVASDGSVFGWGEGSRGVLGNGGTDGSAVPVQVTTAGTPMAGKKIVDLSLGAHVMARASDGSYYAWGLNHAGQLGDGTATDALTPIALRTEGTALGGKALTQVVAGATTTLALDSSGVVYSWGENTNGMLGNGTYVDSPVPTPVPTPAGSPMAGKTIVHIGASGHTMGAVASDGSVFGWGYNPTTDDYYEGESAMWKAPVLVNTAGTSLEGKHITQFRTGLHRLVLASDGSMYSWGYNSSYQIGNGTKVFSPTPSSPMSVASYAFDGVPVALDAERRGTVPAHAPGVVDVTATFEGRTETVVGGYTYQDVPDAPTELTAVPSAGSPQTSIDVTWNNPAYTGRSAITGNPIKYRKAGDLEWSEAADSQIDGLLPGRTYEVVVHSQNSFGLSVASETASVTTTPDVTLAMLTVSLSDPLTPVVQGDTAQFTVTGANTYGDPLPVAPEDVELRSTVGRDVGSGTSMAFDTAGTRTITATVGSVSAAVEVTASPRYIVTWDENWPDAGAPSTDVVTADTLTELPDPSAAGWVITGWNTADQGDGTTVTSSTPLADVADGPNVTLYARWERRTLELSLAKDRVAAGEATAITATANGSFGTTIDATAETAFSSLGDVATVADGSVVSTTAGTHLLEGSFDGAVAQATLTVGPSTVTSLTLTPSATTVDQGASLSFTAEGHDEYGNTIELDPTKAKLTSNVDTDVAEGMTVRFPTASPHVVTLTYDGVTTSATIEVRPSATPPKSQPLVATGGVAVVAVGSAAVALLLLGGMLVLRRRTRLDAH